MFTKIATRSDFKCFWMNADEVFIGVSEVDKDIIYKSLEQLVNIMCDEYGGEARNPEIDGGSVFIFFDKYDTEQREIILEKYNLSEDDYEIRDVLTEENDGYLWVSDVYCFTNYNLVLVYRREL